MGSQPQSAFEILTNTLSHHSIQFSTPSSPDYNSRRLPYNLRLQPKPAIIVIPKDPAQVSITVSAAARLGYKVQARGGGHSYASFSSGGSDGSVVIDLHQLHDVQILPNFTDPESGLSIKNAIAKVGGGARLGNIARHIYSQGKRALPHGTGASVGIGGHATMGGYGYVSRAWGLALDRIVALDVVLADGALVHASKSKNKEVFWAVRGAAHSFGVVVNFYLETEEAPAEVTYVELSWDGMYEDKRRFTDTLLGIQQFSLNGGVVDERLSFGVRVDGGTYRLTGGFLGTAADFEEKILRQLLCVIPSPPSSRTIRSLSWIDFLTECSDEGTLDVPTTCTTEHKTFFATSLTVPESKGLSSQAVEAFFDHIVSPPIPAKYFIVINLHGGPRSAVNCRDLSFSAYADRDSLWTFQIRADDDSSESKAFVKGLTEKIPSAQPNTSFGASLSYIDADLGRDDAWRLYYSDVKVLDRLRALKEDLDPYEVFWNPHSITRLNNRSG